MILKIKKTDWQAIIPTRAHEGDAGLDLYAIRSDCLLSGERKLIHTGIAVAIPYGFVGLIHPRSGMAHKFGVTVANAPGTIDAAYRGEIMINLINLGQYDFWVKPGDRIAQLLVQAVELPECELVDELDETVRGIAGHGSTGF